MQLKQALAGATARLTADQVPSPRRNAELLLMFTLNCDRAYLFAHPERKLTSSEQSRYAAALAERARGVPAQYITGHQEFWGMDFIVTPAVLIPRPETEHVIETVLELAGVGPVSYTHLDVYKRQPPSSRDGFTPRPSRSRSCPKPKTSMSKSKPRICALTPSVPPAPAASR